MTAKEAMEIRNNPAIEDVDNNELHQCIDEALEKQIPKKPKLKPVDGFDSEVASSLCCPTCKNSVINYWCKKINPPHCMMCGQALDWGENNDT